jgi:hypothetical protein
MTRPFAADIACALNGQRIAEGGFLISCPVQAMDGDVGISIPSVQFVTAPKWA